MKTSHSVSVLGREISVRSSASAAKVQQIETFVNTRLQEIGAALKSGDAQLVLTLALLNTTEELFDLQKMLEEDASLEVRLRGMLDKLESA
ncbi:MAG: cell division protein ZapA [Desulfuromonadales bacterium]|nr:cell division protein ZapA [Desulfuromonadales bacterium]